MTDIKKFQKGQQVYLINYDYNNQEFYIAQDFYRIEDIFEELDVAFYQLSYSLTEPKEGVWFNLWPYNDNPATRCNTPHKLIVRENKTYLIEVYTYSNIPVDRICATYKEAQDKVNLYNFVIPEEIEFR